MLLIRDPWPGQLLEVPLEPPHENETGGADDGKRNKPQHDHRPARLDTRR